MQKQSCKLIDAGAGDVSKLDLAAYFLTALNS